MALKERYYGQYKVADSAATYIDANGIISAANAIKSELEEFSNLSGDVRTAGSDLTPQTLYCDGADMSGVVDEVATVITEKYNSMLGNLDSIIAAAEQVYNEKQDQLNQAAYEEDMRLISYYANLKSSSN